MADTFRQQYRVVKLNQEDYADLILRKREKS